MNTTLRQIDPIKAAVYAPEVLAQLPRLLSMLDRERDSASHGSFDREHWGWKFRDFPITTLQSAVYPLALLWRYPFPGNACYGNSRVLAWLRDAIEFTCRRQHANGAFDSVGPYTQDQGVSLYIAYVLTEACEILKGSLSSSVNDVITETVRRSCRFGLRSSEDYAFITNHRAFFALAYLNAKELLNDPDYGQRAERIIDEIVREQSPDGWYREYGGPDPGYESLGIFYLASYWRRTGSTSLLKSLGRSLDFYSHCVHPDGSVGGVYGSRHTQLYFPAGFEMLAAEIPAAATVARFMRDRLFCGNVLTPAATDAENLPSLAYTYLEAALVPEARQEITPAPLPCQELNGARHFRGSGITVTGTPRYYVVINAAKGGVCRVFEKETTKIAYEDAGYLVQADGRRWSSQFSVLGKKIDAAGANQFACESLFAEARQELLTPAKFLLLRVLNLTVFRSVWLGRWVRRLIVARLITMRRPGPLRLRRLVTFEADQIRFCDRLELTTNVLVETAALPRSFTAIHMGSAKYFYASELIPLPEVTLHGMVRELNERRVARCEFTLRFSDTGGPEVHSGPSAEERETVETEAYQRP